MTTASSFMPAVGVATVAAPCARLAGAGQDRVEHGADEGSATPMFFSGEVGASTGMAEPPQKFFLGACLRGKGRLLYAGLSEHDLPPNKKI
jgi:hypothetical protein